MKLKQNAVIIFCRYPDAGKVKKRLAETAGQNFATEFYRICAEHVIGECRKLNSEDTQCYIFYSDENDGEKIRGWIGEGFEYYPQKDGDLGERMSYCYEAVFKQGIKKAVLLGTDIPDISTEIILRSLKKLDSADYVVGAAYDGGFYLLGTKNPDKDLMKNITWGRDDVLKILVKRIARNKYSLKYAEQLIDIDTIEDIKIWLNDDTTGKGYRLKKIIGNLLSGTFGLL